MTGSALSKNHFEKTKSDKFSVYGMKMMMMMLMTIIMVMMMMIMIMIMMIVMMMMMMMMIIIIIIIIIQFTRDNLAPSNPDPLIIRTIFYQL